MREYLEDMFKPSCLLSNELRYDNVDQKYLTLLGTLISIRFLIPAACIAITDCCGLQPKRKVKTDGDDNVQKTKKRKKKSKKPLIERKIHRTLFVGQIPFRTTKEDIQKHFEEAGEIQVRMLTNRTTGKFKGTG